MSWKPCAVTYGLALLKMGIMMPETCWANGLLMNHNLLHLVGLTSHFIMIMNLLIAYLLTYLLTPWSRVLLEKLISSQLVKKFPHFMEPEGSLLHSQVPATWPCYLLIAMQKILHSLRQKACCILLLLLLLLLLFITFIQGIYNYVPETHLVSRVYNVTALLRLQHVRRNIIFHNTSCEFWH